MQHQPGCLCLALCLTALLCTLDVGGVDTGDCSLSRASSVLLSPLGPTGVLLRTAAIRAASLSVAALVVVDATDMGDAAPARLAAASSICTAEDKVLAHHERALAAACCMQCGVDVGGPPPASLIYIPALQHTQHLCWVCKHSAASQLGHFAAAKHDSVWMVDTISQTMQNVGAWCSQSAAAKRSQAAICASPASVWLSLADAMFWRCETGTNCEGMPRCTRASSVSIQLAPQGITRDALCPVTKHGQASRESVPVSFPAPPSSCCRLQPACATYARTGV